MSERFGRVWLRWNPRRKTRRSVIRGQRTDKHLIVNCHVWQLCSRQKYDGQSILPQGRILSTALMLIWQLLMLCISSVVVRIAQGCC